MDEHKFERGILIELMNRKLIDEQVMLSVLHKLSIEDSKKERKDKVS